MDEGPIETGSQGGSGKDGLGVGTKAAHDRPAGVDRRVAGEGA